MTRGISRLAVILVGVILHALMTFGQSHNVPCGSQGNNLELTIKNGSGMGMSNVKLELLNAPEWLHFSANELVLNEVSSDNDGTASFHFMVDKSVRIGSTGTATFRIVAGPQLWTKTISFLVTPPERFELLQNYPNPFNPETKIEYALPKATHVKLVVYSMLGQEIETLVDNTEEAGYKTVRFDARNLPSGVYTYRLVVGDNSDSKKMMLIK